MPAFFDEKTGIFSFAARQYLMENRMSMSWYCVHWNIFRLMLITILCRYQVDYGFREKYHADERQSAGCFGA